MNTVKSFWLGWGALCVGGAGAYYFAKKEINASRIAKLEDARRRKAANMSLEYSEHAPTAGAPARTDTVASPSQEAGNDPAPTRHAPETEGQRVLEKSKYEPSVPFTSRKGDRFS